ncbi:MAG TPA: lysophospholipid acyltransferase family protein [Micromonosporaceae bacterium]
MPLLYTFGQYTVAPMVKLAWRPVVEGLENIPTHGGAVLAGNHLSVADEYVLGAVVPRHIAFWAKSEYFTGTGLSGWAMRSLLTGLGAIPVNREGGRAALTALDAAIPALQGGDLVGVYPEGTRSPDGKLYRGRTGAVRLAILAGVPIVPVGVVGTEKVQPIGKKIPKLGIKVEIKFGKPMDLSGQSMDSSTLRAITDELMSEIQKMTGQEYVPRYAPRRES